MTRRRALPSLLGILGASLALPCLSLALAAQDQAPPPLAPPVPFEVQVTPDAGSQPARPPNSGPYSITFTVRNTGENQDTYSFACNRTGSVTSCGSVNPTSATLASGAQRTVTASYSVGAVGTGTAVLVAEGSDFDSGFYNVTVSATNEAKPGVAFRHFNPDNQDRSLCLTSGAGESAAFQCGDLFIAHGMPGYATLGRERALSLIYNSAQAFPMPRVAVAVTQPANALQPSQVYTELRINGVLRDSSTYHPWGGTAANQVRQIVMKYDVAAGSPMDSTGLYPFTLMVRNIYAASVKDSTISGRLIVVNRTQSEYGAGWSLAGIERLYLNQPVGAPDGTILWVGGDGSAKVYSPHATLANTWVGAKGGFQDLLQLAGGEYTRTLRHGIKVVFNNLGRHIRTVNRAGHVTTMKYGTAGRLDTIIVPPVSTAATKYRLTYAAGKLDRITDPAGRVLDATVSGGVLTSLKDADSLTTSFGYTSVFSPLLVSSRTNRRGLQTTFMFLQNRLHEVRVPVDSPATRVGLTEFFPWDLLGTTGSGIHVSPAPSTDSGQVFTRILGPRAAVADDATFWIDRWGAPVKIVGAINDTTVLFRSDPVVPAMVTRVIHPDRTVTDQKWDGAANLTEIRDSTSHLPNGRATAVTRYEYADANAPHSPSRVTDPAGVATQYVYDSLGLTRQVTAPNGHVTTVRTFPSGTQKGLVRAVTELRVQHWDSTAGALRVDSMHTGFAYNTLGNVVADTSPLAQVRSFTRDAFERVTHSFDAAGHHTEFTYTNRNLVRLNRQHVHQAGTPASLFPADSGYSGPLTTTNVYKGGLLDRVTDPRGVVRSYRYDGGDRIIRETDEDGRTEQRFYDLAGLLDSVRLRTGQVIKHKYDAAGRRTETAWPARDNALADTARFTYDVMGNILTARVRGRNLTRTYNPTGTIRTDVQDGSSQALVTQAYGYDNFGRRVAHRIGTAGSLINSDSVTYRYNARGELATMHIRWRKRFATDPTVFDSVMFAWDSLGRRSTLTYSNGLVARLFYDRNGTLRVVCGKHGGTPPNDALNFTVFHEWVDRDGMTRRTRNVPPSTLTMCGASGFTTTEQNTYWSRHFLRTQTIGPRTSSFVYDSSGNRIRSKIDSDSFRDSMPPARNRLAKHHNLTANIWTNYTYDLAGGRHEETPCSPALGCSPNALGYREHLYDGLGRVSGTDEFLCTQWDGAGGACDEYGQREVATCGYDALGRMTQPCERSAPLLGMDGQNVIRGGADDNVAGWTFIHGPGTDDPLIGFRPFNGLYAFFVTDGAGRQYAVANRSGGNLRSNLEFNSSGGKYAGGTVNSQTYGAERHQSNNQPGLSFYRNRFYDQFTGRWTQEDPIGVAGGVNLYQFNGNNPVMFTDPFGLKECEQRGNCTQSDGGEMEARGVAMRRGDVILPTEASPLFFIGGIQKVQGQVAGAAAQTVVSGTKGAVRKGLGSLGLDNAVEKGVRGVLGSGKGEQWGVEAAEGGGAMVHRYVAGGDGSSSAIYTYIVDAGGKVKGLLQRGFDAAGNLTHFDPK